jgi:hypothetical protein
VRLEERWVDFLILGRAELSLLKDSVGIGYVNRKAGELQLHLTFGPDSVACSGADLRLYRNAWARLPVLRSLPGRPGPGLSQLP